MKQVHPIPEENLLSLRGGRWGGGGMLPIDEIKLFSWFKMQALRGKWAEWGLL